MNISVRDNLSDAGLNPEGIADLVHRALQEDLRDGPDITTSATIAPDHRARGAIVARPPGMMCGVALPPGGVESAEFPLTGIDARISDGEGVGPGDTIMSFTGPLAPLLLAERTMLNLLSHLSGVASATNAWVRELSGTNCRVRDTRKTTPGLRELEKYAVRCGGGTNHRFGLGDAALVKDNHILAAGGITSAVAAIRRAYPHHRVEVECDSLDQVIEAVTTRCDEILLDNMDMDSMREAIALVRSTSSILVEVSGGVTLDRARSIALAGADFIAVGSLTHSAEALDLGLDL